MFNRLSNYLRELRRKQNEELKNIIDVISNDEQASKIYNALNDIVKI